MKKAHVFKYSQVILTKREAAIIEFSKHSGLDIQTIAGIAINQEKSNGVIDQYKIGRITTEEFREEMNKLIGNAGGTPILDNDVFDKCWNAMCVVKPEELTKLYNLQQKHDFHTHIIAGTNKLQHDFIQEEINNTPHNLNITYTLSYILGTLDINKLKHYTETILAQDYELVWHTEEQKEYEQNALKILGEYYNEVSA